MSKLTNEELEHYIAKMRWDDGPTLDIAEELLSLRQLRDSAAFREETMRMQLVACGVAALQNTEKTERIPVDSPYWTASYHDVCRAVDREMDHRFAYAALKAEAEKLVECIEDCLSKLAEEAPATTMISAETALTAWRDKYGGEK